MVFTKETFIKALRTFVQACLAYIAVNITLIDFTNDKEVIRTALIGLGTSAVASGIAAAMNLEKNPKKQLENIENENIEGEENSEI